MKWDNGYERAQRAYDNMEPPESDFTESCEYNGHEWEFIPGKGIWRCENCPAETYEDPWPEETNPDAS